MEPNLLIMRNISKRFPGVQALDAQSLGISIIYQKFNLFPHRFLIYRGMHAKSFHQQTQRTSSGLAYALLQRVSFHKPLLSILI